MKPAGRFILPILLLATGASAQAPIVPAPDQQALLRSDDARLAANKRLVYDMYREVLQGGHYEKVAQYFTPEYLQHNPNVASGRDNLAAFVKGSRPVRPIEPTILFPLISIVAEGNLVVVANGRPETDASGANYMTTWFDMFRIKDGKIAEHWDPALKDAAMLHFDPNSTRQK